MMQFKRRHTTAVLHVGTDLVSVSDVEQSIVRFGDRYLRRVYSAGELTTCVGPDGAPVACRLAARFAAKEATVKALRPSIGLAYTDIELVTDIVGVPTMKFSGLALSWFESLSVSSCSVSVAHEGDLASAVFVASTSTDTAKCRSDRRRRCKGGTK